MVRLGLCLQPYGGIVEQDKSQGTISVGAQAIALTQFGYEFVIACKEPPKKTSDKNKKK